MVERKRSNFRVFFPSKLLSYAYRRIGLKHCIACKNECETFGQYQTNKQLLPHIGYCTHVCLKISYLLLIPKKMRTYFSLFLLK